ncbi:MAG: ABC transporter permease [Bacteroidales bacterium]|nr:ABC transporter permease [Bacteroidales bacterium]
MLSNIIKTTTRFLYKNKVYSIINIFGLAFGLATSILIFLYINDELSYDKFHKDYQHIFRVQEEYKWGDKNQLWATTEGNLSYDIAINHSELAVTSRIMDIFNPPYLYANGNSTSEKRMIFADSTFLNVFSFPLIQSDSGALLNTAEKIMVSKKIANQLFGTSYAAGNQVEVDNEKFTISAVFEDVPPNSHFHFDVVFSMMKLHQEWSRVDSAGPMVFYTYLKAYTKEKGKELQAHLQTNMDGELKKILENDSLTNRFAGLEGKMLFVPISDIHLKSHAEKELENNGNFEYIIIYITVGIFILILAAINYTNLATASSIKRAKEIGMRKVMGANTRNIFIQFISESFALVFASLLISLVMVELSFPYFNAFAGKNLELSQLLEKESIIYFILVILGLSILSGIYPSVFMSRYKTSKILSTKISAGKNDFLNLALRRFLVVSQFAISIFLTITAFTVAKQLRFIQNTDIGFNKEQVVVLPLSGQSNIKYLPKLKNELKHITSVESVSGSSNIPGERFGVYGVRVPELGRNSDNEEERSDRIGVRMLCADHDFLNAFGLEMAEGRTFSEDIISDSTSAFIINESAVEKYNIKDPVGKKMIFSYALKEPKVGTIIGVVKDFHYASFHTEINPLMVHIFPRFYKYIIVKISGNQLDKTIQEIEKTWNNYLPKVPFSYSFLDKTYDNIYTNDTRMGNVFYFFTFIALLLAGMGLYGLAAFITEQRSAEISIRKILGASLGRIMLTLSKEFTILILIANLIAWLPAWFFLKNWLNDFAIRIELGLEGFVWAAFFSLFIGLLTVSLKTYITARTNPVDILKTD